MGIQLNGSSGTDIISAVDGSLTVEGLTISGDFNIAHKIIHSGDTDTFIRFPAANTFTVETAGDERLRIDSTGKVGVGANPTAYPGKFVVSGDALICDRDIHSRVANSVANSDRGFKQDIDGVEKLHLYTDNSNNIILEGNGGAEKLRINNGGSVGIGTISPSVKLHVYDGSIRSSNTGQTNFTELGSDGNIEIKRTGGSAYIDFADATSNDADCRIQHVSDGFEFSTGGQGSRTTKLVINSAGKVRVGSGSATYNLEVQTTGFVETLIGSTNAGGAGIILDGDSNGDGSGGDYAQIFHKNDGTLNFRARNGSGGTDTIFLSNTTETLRIKSDGDIEATGNLQTNNLSGRNVIINGDMRVAQRATSASMSNHGGTIDVCDRWIYSRHGVTATVAQVAEAPAGRGFKYSLKWTSTSAVGSIAAGNSLKFAYNIERQDIQRLGYGSSNAKKATLSFWAKGSLAGKIGVSCTRNSRITSHNVDMTANTWEFHEIVIPIDTSTALSGTDTDSGFYIGICWGGGSNSTSGATNGWINFHNAYTAGFTAGQQGAYLTTSGSTFQITGVQLEVGSVSTPFEHKSYAEELRLCQRYYNEVANTRNQSGNDCTLGMFCQVYNSTGAHIIHQLDPPMRVVPDLVTTQSSGSYVLIVGNSSDTFDEIIENSKNRWTNRNVELWCQTGLSGLTPGHAAFVRLRSAVSTTVVAFDAEL